MYQKNKCKAAWKVIKSEGDTIRLESNIDSKKLKTPFAFIQGFHKSCEALRPLRVASSELLFLRT